MNVPERQFAVDVGNSRIKIGCFEKHDATSCAAEGRADLPLPTESLDLTAEALQHDDALLDVLGEWLDKLNALHLDLHVKPPRSNPLPTWWVGSVNDSLTARLSFAIDQLAAGTVRMLTQNDIPIDVFVKQPDRVGIDRLLAAFAAKQLRSEGTPAIIIDLGTAITVDLLSAKGAFEGGAILPGIGMSAEAMASQTEALPHLTMHELKSPPSPVGKSTQAAIESGLYWGAVGAIRELIVQQSKNLDMPPMLYLTGGTAPQVTALFEVDEAEHKSRKAIHLPYLVLSGILLVGETLRSNR